MAKRRVGEAAPAGVEGGQPGDIAIRGARKWDRLRPGATEGHVLTSNGPGQAPSFKAAPGAGGGDSITVNAAALVDANLSDSTPAAPAGGENVVFQKDASSPANISGYVREATALLRGIIQLAGQLGGSAAAPDVRGLRTTSGPTLLTMGAVADGEVLTRSGSTIIGSTPGGGGGDNVSVNGVAAADADFDDDTPAADTDGDATFDGLNVKFKKDSGTPNKVSAWIGKDINGNWILGFDPQTSAVNYLGIRNAIAGAMPGLFARGTDADVSLALSPKGTGRVFIGDGSVGSAMEFIEMAAPGTPPANDLRAWVEDHGGVSRLKLKDDAGEVANLFNPRMAFLAADRVSTSTSYADVTGFTFAIKANKSYSFEVHLLWSSSATTEGGNFSVNGPASPTNVLIWREVWTSATAHTSERHIVYDAGTLLTAGPGTAFWPIHLFGTVENGANAGILAIRFRAETGGANSVTLRRGSYMKVYEH